MPLDSDPVDDKVGSVLVFAPFQQPALSAENKERVGDEEDAGDDMEAGEG